MKFLKIVVKLKKDSGLKPAANFLLILTIFFNAHLAVFSEAPPVKGFEKNRLIFVQRFLRTELYFGMNKPDESVVTAEEWNKFLADEVTPKFPDGFTVLEGYGQFRDAGGKIIRENSRVLVLLYPLKNRKSSSRKIELIRRAYKRAFQQQSVLRLDFPSAVKVSF